MFVPNIMVIYPMVVESLHSHSKCHSHGGVRGKVMAKTKSLGYTVCKQGISM